MTKRGHKLEGVDEEQLRQQLRTEKDPKAIKRLTTALLYLNGVSATEIGEILGIHVQTIYDWLDVVAERDLDALGDAPHQPTASKLTPEQWESLTAVLHAPPTEVGYDASAWRPDLVHHYIRETFGVEYSLAHMYRVMKRAGLSKQTARPRHYKADPVKQQQWREEFKKSGQR